MLAESSAHSMRARRCARLIPFPEGATRRVCSRTLYVDVRQLRRFRATRERITLARRPLDLSRKLLQILANRPGDGRKRMDDVRALGDGVEHCREQPRSSVHAIGTFV
jgi:hypothetical protein